MRLLLRFIVIISLWLGIGFLFVVLMGQQGLPLAFVWWVVLWRVGVISLLCLKLHAFALMGRAMRAQRFTLRLLELVEN